jgi:diguanylate cyclase (GGDEF)-like protein
MIATEKQLNLDLGLDLGMPNLQVAPTESVTFPRKDSHRLLGEEHAALANRVFLAGWRGSLLPVGGLALIGLIAVLDYFAGPKLSFGILYLVPIALCAWWGGFARGILLSMICAVSWQIVGVAEDPDVNPAIHLWNGIARFGVFAITSSLLSRLRVSLYVEKKMARSDPLTGAANGRTFYETVSQHVEYALHGDRPITLAYLDLDQFKWLNDKFGHAAGDEVLCNLVQMTQQEIRQVDLLARLGGDEFALLLFDCGEAPARAILERVRERFAQEMTKKKWPVTVSVGAVTFLHPVRDVDAIVRQIDERMYRAKKAGRNCIVHDSLGAEESETEKSKVVERRAMARAVCDRVARIKSKNERECDDEYARVRDISGTGLCLILEHEMPANTLLAIEPLHECGAASLLARVMWSVEENGSWLHECVLPNRLTAEHLQIWVQEQTAELCR